MKKKYEKPSVRVIELQHNCQILAGSDDPVRDVPLWDGEGGSRQHNGVWGDGEEE